MHLVTDTVKSFVQLRLLCRAMQKAVSWAASQIRLAVAVQVNSLLKIE